VKIFVQAQGSVFYVHIVTQATEMHFVSFLSLGIAAAHIHRSFIALRCALVRIASHRSTSLSLSAEHDPRVWTKNPGVSEDSGSFNAIERIPKSTLTRAVTHRDMCSAGLVFGISVRPRRNYLFDAIETYAPFPGIN